MCELHTDGRLTCHPSGVPVDARPASVQKYAKQTNGCFIKDSTP
jgi:hypothetical protein